MPPAPETERNNKPRKWIGKQPLVLISDTWSYGQAWLFKKWKLMYKINVIVVQYSGSWIFKNYILLIAIKYWLYSPVWKSTVVAFFIPNSLYLSFPTSILPLPPSLSSLVTTCLFSMSESASLLYSLVCCTCF